MAVKTLKTLVHKTASVGSVKLSTSADRIGLGLTAIASYPTDILSQGQFPLPHNPQPGSNSGPCEAQSAMQLQEQMPAEAPSMAPAGPAGCLSVPGSSACRTQRSFTRFPLSGWRATAKRVAAAGRSPVDTAIFAVDTGLSPAATSRASFSGFRGLSVRLGRDCQSPDRMTDRQDPSVRRSLTSFIRTWETTSASAAGK
jgi:hypothetical protein